MPIIRPGFALFLAAFAGLTVLAPVSLRAQQGPMPVTVSKPVMRKVVETADFTGR